MANTQLTSTEICDALEVYAQLQYSTYIVMYERVRRVIGDFKSEEMRAQIDLGNEIMRHIIAAVAVALANDPPCFPLLSQDDYEQLVQTLLGLAAELYGVSRSFANARNAYYQAHRHIKMAVQVILFDTGADVATGVSLALAWVDAARLVAQKHGIAVTDIASSATALNELTLIACPPESYMKLHMRAIDQLCDYENYRRVTTRRDHLRLLELGLRLNAELYHYLEVFWDSL